MTPDKMVAEIFRIQNERAPDEDPGDISIDIQDDSALHTVMQSRFNGTAIIGAGPNIQEALESALRNVRVNRTMSFLPKPSRWPA